MNIEHRNFIVKDYCDTDNIDEKSISKLNKDMFETYLINHSNKNLKFHLLYVFHFLFFTQL